MSEHILSANADRIVTLTLARPAKKNALSDAMYAVLADAIEAAEQDAEVRVIVIRAEGDDFSAGNDLGDFAKAAAEKKMPQQVLRFLDALAHAKKPIIAAAQGLAVGIGTTMLLHCDYVVLGDTARLTTPFVNLALVPEAASSLLLPARIGHVRAFSMFALGEAVDADKALQWGLANQVVPVSELHAAAHSVAKRLARQAPGAVQTTKALMRDTDTLSARMKLEVTHFAERLLTAEAREVFKAFAEKRAPKFD